MNFNPISPAKNHLLLNTSSHHSQKSNNTLIREIVDAILRVDEETARRLIPTCPDLNACVYYDYYMRPIAAYEENANAFTPLLMAIRVNNVALAQFLVDCGADVNHVTTENEKYPLFPLIYATTLGRHEIMDLLAKHGVNPTQLDSDGYNSLTRTLVSNVTWPEKRTAIAKLEKMGLCKRLSRSLLLRIELAHIWAIGGCSSFVDETNKEQKIQLFGLTIFHARKIADKYVTRFLASTTSSEEEKQKLGFLKHVFKMQHNEHNLLKHAQNGAPIVVFGGYIGHAITSVIYKGHLAIQNRASGGEGHTLTTDLYNLPDKFLSFQLLRTLSYRYTGYTSFTDAIKGLSLTKLPAARFNQKYLKGDYCGWGDGKAAINTLLLLEFGDSGKDLYKKFTLFTRLDSLARYRKVRRNQDKSLLNRVKIKWKNKYKKKQQTAQQISGLGKKAS